MTTIAGWQDAYYLVGSTAITETPSFSADTCLGEYGEGHPQVFTKNHSEFESGLAIIESNKVSSFAYKIKGGNTNLIERAVGAFFPIDPIETSLDCLSGFLSFLTLFQMPNTGFANETYKTFIPYSTNYVRYYSSLLRTLEEGDSYQVDGAVAQTVTISGSEGEDISISTDWAGARVSTGASVAVCGWSNSASRTPLLFQDLTCAYESTAQTVNLESFEITITNNATHPTYNRNAVARHILGDLEVAGTLKVPWSSTIGGKNEFITRLLSGERMLVYLWWGNLVPSQDGDFVITMNIEVNTSLLDSSDEDSNEVSFVGVFDGTTYPIKIDSYFGDVFPTISTFSVKNASAVSYSCSNQIINASGTGIYVSNFVANASGNEFNCTG